MELTSISGEIQTRNNKILLNKLVHEKVTGDMRHGIKPYRGGGIQAAGKERKVSTCNFK